MATNYQKGRGIEYKAMQVLENAGYIALRTAGSHGPFDVIGINHQGVRLIQIKRCQDRAGKFEIEREQLERLNLPPGTSAELWVWIANQGWVKQEIIKKGA